MNLLSATHSDSRRANVLREFKAALETVDIAIADEIITAIGSTAATVDAVTDDEIVQYLGTDDDATRTLLRNVLAQSFTEHEMAVFWSVIAGGDVEAALAAASYTDAWKKRVRDLLDSHNVGDIRIAMNGAASDPTATGFAPTTRRSTPTMA